MTISGCTTLLAWHVSPGQYFRALVTRRSSRLGRDHPKRARMFVHILYSEKSSRYYVGQTADIIKRLKRHNLGIVPSTKSGAPWRLVLQIEVLSRSEALILERRIKKRGAKRFLDDHFGV